jgi:hypothetical protein
VSQLVAQPRLDREWIEAGDQANPGQVFEHQAVRLAPADVVRDQVPAAVLETVNAPKGRSPRQRPPLLEPPLGSSLG